MVDGGGEGGGGVGEGETSYHTTLTLKGLFHLHTKTDLQSAYILVLILVV